MNTADNDNFGVLLINMGGPADLDGIEDYLFRLLSDPMLVRMPLPLFAQRIWARRIAHIRAGRVRPRYEAIGGSSPLLQHTFEQASALEKTLGIPVEVGMSYSPPFVSDAMQTLAGRGIRRVVALPLYPQYSGSTSGSALADARKCAAAAGVELLEIQSHHNNGGFASALSGMLLEYLPLKSEGKTHVLFVAHSLPEKYIRQGDPYQTQLLETMQAVSVAIPDGVSHSIAYSSRMGPMRWLGPSVEEEIERLASENVETLVVQTLSFVSEHLETLYDLDMEAAGCARQFGIKNFIRVPAVGSHTEYISGLADAVRVTVEKGEAGND